ncbi:15113_t:CDS:2, partial [Racocetra fulgida]
ITDAKGMTLRIVAVDVGMIIMDYLLGKRTILALHPYFIDAKMDVNILFHIFSNGPGDPTMVKQTIERLKVALKEAKTPIFG